MHRATERRWATLFLILLAAAAILQLLGFFLPNWLRVYDPQLKIAQDYALWYVTQCYEERWSCNTRTYYQLYNWLNANHTFDGVPLCEYRYVTKLSLINAKKWKNIQVFFFAIGLVNI